MTRVKCPLCPKTYDLLKDCNIVADRVGWLWITIICEGCDCQFDVGYKIEKRRFLPGKTKEIAKVRIRSEGTRC